MTLNQSISLETLKASGLIGEPQGAGWHLAKFLERKGLTKAEAARMMGVPTSTLSRVVNGETELTENLAIKLGRHLEAPVALLFRLDADAKSYRVNKALQAA